jgi:uncharacterized heparinase superfamily protein
MLVLSEREVWSFSAEGVQIELEEGVYLGAPEGPRRTLQMVIYGSARERAQVNWGFSRSSSAATATRRRPGEAPELPL